MYKKIITKFKQRSQAFIHHSLYQKYSDKQYKKSSNIAVHIHLYYPEMWGVVSSHLSKLSEQYDLYITLPVDKAQLLPEDIKGRPRTFILNVPNRGRDVLPFLYVVSKINTLGYEAILKIHTKKSPHFEGGGEWFEDTLKSLTSVDVQEVIKTFRRTPTVVGPEGYYTSLLVNFEANGSHLHHILKREFNDEIIYTTIQAERAKHGFFAGTMFWVAPSYISSKIFRVHSKDFENEAGQIDGTYAHALERAFSVVAQMRGKQIFQTGGKNILVVNNERGVIPEWSDQYVPESI